MPKTPGISRRALPSRSLCWACRYFTIAWAVVRRMVAFALLMALTFFGTRASGAQPQRLDPLDPSDLGQSTSQPPSRIASVDLSSGTGRLLNHLPTRKLPPQERHVAAVLIHRHHLEKD